MAPVRIAIVGAGSRGQAYASWITKHPELAVITAIADPSPARRAAVAPGALQFGSWRELAAAGEPHMADAVVVATPDFEHVGPVTAFAPQGYAILLEKPIAPTEAECHAVADVIRDARVTFAVCHVLRHAPYTDVVREVIDSGVLGDIVNVDHVEPVGWWHAAHSFVRGNWRSAKVGAPMLLAKSCHDLDWIAYVTGQRFERVSSFGSLRHFTRANQPAEAADRCLDCPLVDTCAYSAPRIYLAALALRGGGWPVDVVTDDATEAGVLAALRTGPYGRCVYACDNDVVDNQVVAFSMSGGINGTFTMTDFSEQRPRLTRIFGTQGCLEGDGERLRIVDFTRNAVEEIDVAATSSNAGEGHGGGDGELIAAFVRAVAGDERAIRSGLDASLQSHAAVFAAERARETGTVVRVARA